MVGTGNLIWDPSPEYYKIFSIMTIYSDILHWSDITPIFDPVADFDLVTEFDIDKICPFDYTAFVVSGKVGIP